MRPSSVSSESNIFIIDESVNRELLMIFYFVVHYNCAIITINVEFIKNKKIIIHFLNNKHLYI